MEEDGVARAVELFSGIGGWSFALARLKENRVRVEAAFDSNEGANLVYDRTFRLTPIATDLAVIPAKKLARFSVWLMSPPCQPYTSGGKRLDDEDARSAALLRLIHIIDSGDAIPDMVALENVPLFQSSRCRDRLVAALAKQHFVVAEYLLSPETLFGFPNRRFRYYLVASRKSGAKFPEMLLPELPEKPITLAQLIQKSPQNVDSLCFPRKWREKNNGFRFHIVDEDDPFAVTQCFTKHYYETYNSGGSYLRTVPEIVPEAPEAPEVVPEVPESVRFFSPYEACALMGFPEWFNMEEFANVSRKSAFRLIGNSLHVAVAARVLALLF